MIIQIHVSMPISEAQGVKESIAMRLEDMAQVVKVVAVLDDGYGKQEQINLGTGNEVPEK